MVSKLYYTKFVKTDKHSNLAEYIETDFSRRVFMQPVKLIQYWKSFCMKE